LAEGATEAFGKSGGIRADFTLSKATEVFLKEIFDGIFNCDDVAGSGLIEPFETSGQCGGLSCARRASDENESRWAREPLLQKFRGETKLFHGGNLGLDVAKNGTADTELAMEVNPETKA